MLGQDKTIERLGFLGRVLFLLVLFSLVFLYGMRPNWSIDIYWHIKVGEWIVRHGAIPHTDIFSAVDPSRPWTPFQWLYEVIVFLVDHAGGFFWLKIMHSTLYVAGFLLFYRFFRKNTPKPGYALFFITLLVFLSEDRIRLRPEAFNTFFLGLIFPYVLAPVRKTNWKELTILFVVALLWGSIHAGGALMLPILFGGVLVGRAVSKLVGIDIELSGDLYRFLASSAVLLVLPGFVKGVYTAFFMYAHSYALIPEWHPPIAYFDPRMVGRVSSHHIVDGVTPYLTTLATYILFSIYLVRNKLRETLARLDGGYIAIALGLALLSIKSCRFIFFAVIPLLLMFIWWVFPRIKGHAEYYLRLVLTVLAVAGLMLSFEYNVLNQQHGLKQAVAGISVNHEKGKFPEKAGDVMVSMGLKGKIFHYTQWGGYLLWRLYPNCTVFTDGRGNFTADEMKDLVSTHRPYEREASLEKAWNKYHFDIVIFSPPMFPLLSWDHKKWIFIYGDSTAEVFLRNSPENRENIQRAMRYWRTMGLVFRKGDPVSCEHAYLDLLSYRNFEQRTIRKQMKIANAMLESDNPKIRLRGLMNKGLIYFTARRYETAIDFFKKALKIPYPNPIGAIYLAWSYYNFGRMDKNFDRTANAKKILSLYFPPGRHRPRLNYGTKRIADLLAKGLGLPSIFHTNESKAKFKRERDNQRIPIVKKEARPK